MATNIRSKIILMDSVTELEKAINDFFTAISNRKVYNVLVSASPLHNGNKIYVATIDYDSVTASASAPTIKLFEQDSIYTLQNEINAYIAPLSGPSAITTSEIILKNGNNSFLGMVGYNFTPSPSSGTTAIESGTFTRSAAAGSGVQTIVTVNRPKLIFFTASGGVANGSSGTDDGTLASCLSTSPVGANNADLTNSINTGDLTGGMTAKVTAITSASFSVTWVKSSAGKNMTVNWYAIT